MIHRRPATSRTHRRGAIFVLALALTVMLSALLIVYSQEMRTEMVASANRLAEAQADGVEQGAEQWVLAEVEANTTPLVSTGGTSTSSSSSASNSASGTAASPSTIPAEAIQIGNGYFWLLSPDPTQDQTYKFGIVDETGKLNLNGANQNELLEIPNMSQELAESITNWPSSTAPSGTTLTYESVEELLLVDQTMTPQVLYGYDLNRDGVIDQAEQAAANGAAVTNGTTMDSRGMANYLTAYSTRAQPGTPGTTRSIPATRSTPLVKKTIGLINVNTAPLQVLMCLPGLSQAQAQSLISTRANLQSTGTSWVSQAIGSTQAAQIAPYITGVSYQYSADIVAVTGDGRAFKRVRIVVDCRQQPAQIIYRKDLTSLGWPLPPEVRDSMRAGKGIPPEVTGTTNAETTGLLQGQ